MSDDEEVVLKNCELHKYMKINDIFNVEDSFAEMIFDYEQYKDRQNNDTGQPNCNNILHPLEKIRVNKYTGNVISIIMNTGLLYPDHILDLESILEMDNVKENKSKPNIMIYLSSLFAASSVLMIMNKNFKMLQYLSLTASMCFGYKTYSVLKMNCLFNKVRNFMKASEQLFLCTKRTLSFITENEFLLRNKMIRNQQFYAPSSGWVESNTKEGLKCSGLIVLELRKVLLYVYLDVIRIFDNFFKFMKIMFLLKPHIENDMSITVELNKYYNLKKQNAFIPSSDDLKRLNNTYLVAQSGCLKHFILCFVEDLWINRSNNNNIEPLVSEGINFSDRFNKYTCELELQYHKCINDLKNNSSQIRKHDLLKPRNVNDKIYTFVNSFLIKADAHMLSILLDLKMIKDWVNECEESNSDDSAKFIVTLHDRLHLMKNNLQCFSNLYNDNCNILKQMNNPSVNNTTVDDMENVDVKLNNCAISTGIEVGKSDFNISGGDEVLISLSNNDVDDLKNASDDNYEDNVLHKCLPGSVLDELKTILKDKKEEWLEREKKATLNSSMTIDNLDCDNLNLNDNSTNLKNLDKHSIKNDFSTSNSSRYNVYDNNSASPSFEETSSSDYKTIRNSSQNPENIQTNKIIELELRDETKEISQFDANDYNDDTCNYIKSSVGNTFANQIKLAQRSFNINLSEDVLEDCCENEELNS